MNAPLFPAPTGWTTRCRVSVIIRAFNQEQSIAAAIESSLAAVSEVGGEVVLADSHSTDRTVEIASGYPIRIVQLLNPGERSSSAASELGFQHSCGDYLYLLDGTMRMVRGFLPRALGFLAQHPEAAGVGGRLVQLGTDSLRPEFPFNPPQRAAAAVDRLQDGGLYRRRAIEESGYLCDRNLHSHEAFELAVRLRALGWKLWRIPVDVATQDPIDSAPRLFLMRYLGSRSACGLGELVRAAAGHKRLRRVWRGQPELRGCAGVLAWWCLLLSVVFWPLALPERLACFAALAAAPWLLMLWRERSPGAACRSLAASSVGAAGLLRGLLRPRRPTRGALACRVLHEPPQPSAPPSEHRAWPDFPDRHRFQN